MLYLFNTGARTEYVKNVLNTLSFPSGAINVYQYSETSGDYNYVDSSASPKLPKALIGKAVMVFYMDRDQDPFRVFPLRKGILADVEEKDGRVYYYVKLGDYAYVESIDGFNAQMQSCLSDCLYRETRDDKWQVAKSGYFAFLKENEACKDLIKIIHTGEDEWGKTIGQIKNCKKFKDENECVFTKFSLFKGEKEITPSNKKKEWYYSILPHKKYTVVVEYRFVKPTMFEKTSRRKIVLSLGEDGSKNKGWNREKEIGNAQSKVEFPLYADELGSYTIKQKFGYSNDDTEIINYAQKEIYFKKGTSTKRVVLIIALVLVLFISSVVSGLETNDIISKYEELKDTAPLNRYQEGMLWLARKVDEYCEIVPTITAAIKTACTTAIAWLLGKGKKE